MQGRHAAPDTDTDAESNEPESSHNQKKTKSRRVNRPAGKCRVTLNELPCAMISELFLTLQWQIGSDWTRLARRWRG